MKKKNGNFLTLCALNVKISGEAIIRLEVRLDSCCEASSGTTVFVVTVLVPKLERNFCSSVMLF